MNVTLDQLKYFYEAARLQHVGKAAIFVHISPSAISSAISSLESELGCKLFDRTRKSVVLTDAGKRLKDEAEKLLDHVQAIKGVVQGQSNLNGTYRIGASHFLSSHFLTPAWSKLQSNYQNLVGDICSFPTAQVVRELVLGTLDVGLCFSPIQHPELSQSILYRGRLVITVCLNHVLLKRKGKLDLQELNKFPAVIHKGQPGVELCEAHPVFARYGVRPDIRFSFDNDTCAVERVRSSDSWTMIPDLVARSHSQQVKMINHPSNWDPTYFVALVVRKDREKNPVVQALRVQLENLFSDLK